MKKLIKFNNGKWGIRYGLFFHRFQDFRNLNFRWGIGSVWFEDCQTDEETARNFFVGPTDEIVE